MQLGGAGSPSQVTQHHLHPGLLSQVDLLTPTHVGNGVVDPARRKRLLKITRFPDPAPNATRLHSECLVLCPRDSSLCSSVTVLVSTRSLVHLKKKGKNLGLGSP